MQVQRRRHAQPILLLGDQVDADLVQVSRSRADVEAEVVREAPRKSCTATCPLTDTVRRVCRASPRQEARDRPRRRRGTSIALQLSLTCQCASCRGQWFDLSTRAFKRLAPISVGVKTKIQWRRVKGPKHWSTRVYGPRVRPALGARLIAAESVQVIDVRQQRFSHISAFRRQACLLCPHSFRPRRSPPSFLAPVSRTDASFALQSVPQHRRHAPTAC